LLGHISFGAILVFISDIFWRIDELDVLLFGDRRSPTRTIYLPLALVTYIESMIISFGSKKTESIWNGERVKNLPLEVQKIGRRKLRMLNNAQNITDLRVPPSNRLEKLKGDLKRFYSIRINDQWRIIFQWNKGQALEVEIMDYH